MTDPSTMPLSTMPPSSEPPASPSSDQSSSAETSAPAPASRLKPLRVRGRVLAWAIAGVITSGAGLLLITGLAGTPWLFLLYPILIGLLLMSLSAIALHLLHRF